MRRLDAARQLGGGLLHRAAGQVVVEVDRHRGR
jgi:hypothetical protein